MGKNYCPRHQKVYRVHYRIVSKIKQIYLYNIEIRKVLSDNNLVNETLTLVFCKEMSEIAVKFEIFDIRMPANVKKDNYHL